MYTVSMTKTRIETFTLVEETMANPAAVRLSLDPTEVQAAIETPGRYTLEAPAHHHHRLITMLRRLAESSGRTLGVSTAAQFVYLDVT